MIFRFQLGTKAIISYRRTNLTTQNPTIQMTNLESLIVQDHMQI